MVGKYIVEVVWAKGDEDMADSMEARLAFKNQMGEDYHLKDWRCMRTSKSPRAIYVDGVVAKMKDHHGLLNTFLSMIQVGYQTNLLKGGKPLVPNPIEEARTREQRAEQARMKDFKYGGW